jgi:hypothetical protein
MKYLYIIFGISLYISLITLSSAMIVKYENTKQYESAKVFLAETLEKVKQESLSSLPAPIQNYVETKIISKPAVTEVLIETKPEVAPVVKKTITETIKNVDRENEDDEDEDD